MPYRPTLLLAATLTVCVAGSAACSSAPPEATWTYGGRPVVSIEQSLSSIESAWRGSVANVGTRANVPSNAQCYLQVRDTGAIADRVLCGPMRLLGDATTTFQSHPLAGADDYDHTDAGDGIPGDDPGDVRLVLAPDAGATSTTFTPAAQPEPDTVALRRPGGAAAPLTATVDQPTVVVASAPAPTLAERLDGRRITARTPAGPVELVVARTTKPVEVDPGSGTGAREVPPAGGSLLVVSATGLGLGAQATATSTPDPASPPAASSNPASSTTSTSTDAVVVVDGRTTVLPADQVASGDVVPIPAGASSVSVGVTYAGRTQRFDPASGRRLTTNAASFYDGLAGTATARCAGVAPNTPNSSRTTVTTAGWQQRFSCDIALVRTSYLPPAPRSSARQVSGWAADGTTFVVLVVTPDDRTTYARPRAATVPYAASYFSFGTRLVVGGAGYEPKELLVQQADGTRSPTVTAVFEVPAGQSAVEVRGFVSTRLEAPAGADQRARTGAPEEGNFTYPVDSRATFATTSR